MDTADGFVGCIRRLEINNKIYNFEPAERQGDVLFGIDIGELSQFTRVNHGTYDFTPDISDECPEDTCSSVPCQNGGVCTAPEYDSTFERSDRTDGGGGVCQCPLGFVGEYCEEPVEVKVSGSNGDLRFSYKGIWSSIKLKFG